MSLAMEILHFKYFTIMLNADQIDICNNLREPDLCNEKEKEYMNGVIKRYVLFSSKTRQGLHGKTPDFLDQVC